VVTSRKQKLKLRAQQLPSRSASRQQSPSPYRAGTPFGFWPDWNVDQQCEWVERNVITWGNKTDKEKAAWYLQKDKGERLLAEERDKALGSRTRTPTMSHAPSPGPSTTTPSAPPSISASATVTANDMKRVIYDLGVVVGQIAQQLCDLTAEARQSQVTKPRTHNMPPVPHPKAWDGKGGSVEARHFLAAFYNYRSTLGEPMNSYDDLMGLWHPNHRHWIQTALNLMEGDACTWALPYLEDVSQGNTPFRADWALFTDTFLKRFAPLDLSESAHNALKAIKQGKGSVAEYIANFDQYTSQTGWLSRSHKGAAGMRSVLTFEKVVWIVDARVER
jgi:hypothetical protein